MKVLVTGAAGFIGSHTVDVLAAEGHQVLGIDSFRTGRLENLKQALSGGSFELVEADITGSPILSRLVETWRPRAIIHLAGLVSVVESIAEQELNYSLNVHATHLVAQAARVEGVERVVFASSAAVYGRVAQQPIAESAPKNPLSPYGWAKLASEALLFSAAQSSAYTAQCLRYFNVYGSRQDPSSPYSGVLSIFAQRAIAGQPLTLFGTGEQTRDFIHVSDIAKANVLAATCPLGASHVLNICTGKAVTLLEILDVLRTRFANLTTRHQTAREADIDHSLGDAQTSLQVLGFKASVPLREGLDDLLSLGL